MLIYTGDERRYIASLGTYYDLERGDEIQISTLILSDLVRVS
jgi:hypothetical protein